MTIRTIEDHMKLNTDEKLKYGEYLPVSLAYLLPCLFQTFADVSVMKDEESCRAEMMVVQTILDSNPNLTVKGFKPSHKCRLDYSKNLRTFAEAHQNIDGKPSIGIQFTDADDGYNDWVWIAVDVIRDFRYTTLSFGSDETERLYSEIKRMSGPKPDEPEKPKEIDTRILMEIAHSSDVLKRAYELVYEAYDLIQKDETARKYICFNSRIVWAKFVWDILMREYNIENPDSKDIYFLRAFDYFKVFPGMNVGDGTPECGG